MSRKQSLVRFGFTVLLFLVGCGATLLVIRSLKKPEAPSFQPLIGNAANIPGVNKGDVVALPELTTLDNERRALGQLKEKYLLCGFVSSSCPACADDVAFWRAVSAEAARRGVAFYLINIDQDPVEVRKFAAAYGFEDMPVLYDSQRQAVQAFKVELVPQYILLTSEGKVLERWMGVRRYDAKQPEQAKVEQMFAPIAVR